MASKSMHKFFMFVIVIWSVSAIVACSTLTPGPIPTATMTMRGAAISIKTPVPSATITQTPEPSPTPYTGPNILFYVQNNNKLLSIRADGSDQREIAQGGQFSFSPDKKKLVYRTAETMGSDDDEVIVLDLAQEKVIFRWSIPGYCEGVFLSSGFEWASDSQRIAFTLTRYDGVDLIPNCKLQYNYEDMGIYQIDLASAEIAHPPLIDIFIDYLNTVALYSPDGSKIRLGPRGATFDAKTWEKIESEPFYDTIQLCDQPKTIGLCNRFNLCLYDQNNQISKSLAEYGARPELGVQSSERIDTFKLFANCSSVVYQTQRVWMPPLTPEPNNKPVFFVRTLHVMSLSGSSDQLISIDATGYALTPDNSKIVIYERGDATEESSIDVVNSDGSNRHCIAKFTQRHAPIFGQLIMISPIGEKVAFVNSEGIATVDLDGNNLMQIVNLSNDVLSDPISLEILDWQ